MEVILEYIKYSYKKWILVFVAVTGFYTSVITVMPQISIVSNIEKIAVLFLIFFTTIVICLLLYLIRDFVENLPIDDLLFEPNCNTKILFPYNVKYLKAINRIANSYYKDFNPNIKILKSWYEKNPFTLITLADRNSKIIGYYDILPLKDEFAKKFIKGDVTESNIISEVILTKDKMKDANYIYFAGVAIKDYTQNKNRIYSGQLLYTAFIYLKKFYNLDNDKVIFATATTKCGEVLLKRLGFTLESNKNDRLDKTDLYTLKINSNTIESARDEIAVISSKIDYSSISK
jgi:hypothetical protein